MSGFSDNANRYRATHRKFVGGSPNNEGRVVLTGTRQSDPLSNHMYFFDKGWLLDRENPGSVVEGLDIKRLAHKAGSSPDPYNVQLLLRLERSITNPASLQIPLTVSASSLYVEDWSPDLDTNTWNMQFNNKIYARMIKESLRDAGYCWNDVNYWAEGLANDDLVDIDGGLMQLSWPYNGTDVDTPTYTINDFKCGPILGRYFPGSTETYYGVLLAWGGNADSPGVWTQSGGGAGDVIATFTSAVTNILNVTPLAPRAFMLDQDSLVVNP